MSMKKRLISACAGVLAVGALSAAANAALTIDIQQAGTNVTEVRLTDADLNKPITLNIFASITGAAGNAEPELFQMIRGDIVASGTTVGTLAPAGFEDKLKKKLYTGIKLFSANGSLTGDAVDVNGDGHVDMKDVAMRASEPQFNDDFGGAGTTLPDGGVKFLVGTITFTPTALGGLTTISFNPLMDGNSIAAGAGLWTEDGADQLRDGSSGTMITNGFQIIVPEPASLSVLGLGGALLLGRRNRK